MKNCNILELFSSKELHWFLYLQSNFLFFFIKLYKKNLLSYDASNFHALESKVTINNEEITSSVQISKSSTASVDVYFTPIIAGTYVIAVSSNNSLITKESITQEFKSGMKFIFLFHVAHFENRDSLMMLELRNSFIYLKNIYLVKPLDCFNTFGYVM